MVQGPMGNCAKRPWRRGPKVGRPRGDLRPEIWVAPCAGQVVDGDLEVLGWVRSGPRALKKVKEAFAYIHVCVP